MNVDKQEDLKVALINTLRKTNCIYIYGKKGIGKSYTIKNTLLEYYNYEPTEYTKNSNLEYMLLKLGQLKNRNSNANELIDDINGIVSETQKLNIIKPLILLYKFFLNFKYKKISHKYSNIKFTHQEISLILYLKEKSKKNTIYVCFDNIEMYNDEVNSALSKILSLNLLSTFYKNKVKFIFIENIDGKNSSSINHLIKTKIYFEYNTDSFLSDIKIILSENNNVKLSNIVRMSQKSIENAIFIHNQYENLNSGNICENTLSEFCNQILLDIIGKGTLEVASIIDNVFNITTICNIILKKEDDVYKDLKLSEERGIIKETNKEYDFVFMYIKNIIYQSVNNQIELHKIYANYLIRTTPNDYMNILYHLFKSNQNTLLMQKYFSAKIMHFLLRVHESNQFIIDTNIKQEIDKQCETNVHYKLLDDLISSTDNVDDKINILINQIPNAFIKKYSTLAFCFKKILIKDYKNLEYICNTILEISDYLLEIEEYDLYVEMMLRLITLYDYRLSNSEKAILVKNRIYNFLELKQKVFSNQYYQKIFCKFFRHNNTLLNNSSAYDHSKRYVSLFLKNINLDFFEKYAVLNNHIGLAITCGDFSIINNKEFEKFKDLVDQGNQFYMDKLFKLESNIIICSIFNSISSFKKKDIKIYINTLSKYLNNNYVSKMFLLNMATFYMLNDNLKSTESILNELQTNSELLKSDYCFLYVYSNLISLYILKNNYTQAANYLNELTDRLKMIPDTYQLKPLFIVRNDIYKQIIYNKVSFNSGISLFKYCYFYKNWLAEEKFYMTGILFTELTVYNE